MKWNHIPSCIVLYLERIPEGVVGLIAGKLTEEYGVPSIVLTDTVDSELMKGSGRNDLDNMNLKSILDDCSDLLVKYGGHEAAAGLSLKKTDLKAFQKAMEKAIEPYVRNHTTERYYDLEVEDWRIFLITIKNFENMPLMVMETQNQSFIFQITAFFLRLQDSMKHLAQKKNIFVFLDTTERPLDFILQISIKKKANLKRLI